MPNFRFYLYFLLPAFLNACNNVAPPKKPNAIGNAFTILLVADTVNNKTFINEFELKMQKPYPALTHAEKWFEIRKIQAEKFNKLLQKHHIILIIKNTGIEKPLNFNTDVQIKYNVWAQPQTVIQLNAVKNITQSEIQQFCNNLFSVADNAANRLLQAQSLRLFNYSGVFSFQNKALFLPVPKKFNKALEINKNNSEVLQKLNISNLNWLRNFQEKHEDNLVVFNVNNTFDIGNGPKFSELINTVGKNFLIGKSDSIYFKLNKNLIYDSVNLLNNLKAQRIRGIWQMQNAFLGGPFAAYIVKINNEYLVVLAFIQAAGREKKLYLREVESYIQLLKFDDFPIDNQL